MLGKIFKKNGRRGFKKSLLLAVLIVGILGATAVSLDANGLPFYGGYVGDAKASEAITQMQALVRYAQTYINSHPHNWAEPGMLLGTDANGTTVTGDGDWIENIVVGNNVYFDYDYVAGTRQIRAWGKASPFDSNDRLTATLGDTGSVTWSASGKMKRVKM